DERRQMYGLMAEHYEQVDPAVFAADLAEKQWVIVVSDGARLLGFTTLKLLETSLNGKPLRALYSGDTALDPVIWGSSSWGRVWGRGEVGGVGGGGGAKPRAPVAAEPSLRALANDPPPLPLFPPPFFPQLSARRWRRDVQQRVATNGSSAAAEVFQRVRLTN